MGVTIRTFRWKAVSNPCSTCWAPRGTARNTRSTMPVTSATRSASSGARYSPGWISGCDAHCGVNLKAMDILNILSATALRFLPLLATLVVVTFLLMFLNRHFRKRWKDNPDLQFRFQLIMLALTMAGALAVIIALPVDDVLRGQLLSLIGILLSAAIALSSTTFIGNILAGIMLKAIKSVRPGDFITVGDLTGRVTEMDLLHTQVQTEFRDLVTVPNLFMVTQPLHVVRKSGTIVGCKLSLGYDVHHERVEEILLAAASRVGLKDAFVQ